MFGEFCEETEKTETDLTGDNDFLFGEYLAETKLTFELFVLINPFGIKFIIEAGFLLIIPLLPFLRSYILNLDYIYFFNSSYAFNYSSLFFSSLYLKLSCVF